jgi:hypothetical protein
MDVIHSASRCSFASVKAIKWLRYIYSCTLEILLFTCVCEALLLFQCVCFMAVKSNIFIGCRTVFSS